MTRLILIALLLFPLFVHPCFAIDAQEKAPETDLPKRVERLELQQELHKNAQDQRLDERLKILETTVKDRHDSVVRESDRLHDRADTQLNWMMWGLGGLGLLAAIGAVATAFLIYPKVKQAEKDQKECTKLREEIKTIKGEIDIIYSKALKKRDNISEIADEVKAKKNEILSNEISPEDAKRSKDYMNRKEAQAALFSQAMIHTQEKKWDAALVLWQDYIKYDPENAEALFYAALSAGELANHPEGKYHRDTLLEQADKWYERSDALAPNLSTVLCNWGVLLQERGRNSSGNDQQRFWEQAEEKYHRATDINPQDADVWYNWGLLLLERGKNATENDKKQQFWDDAADKYRRATDADSQHASAWYNWGALLSERGRKTSGDEQQRFWDDAENKYRRATEVNPQHANAWFGWGTLLLERGKNATENDGKQQFWDDAENKYRRATDADSQHANAWFGWGTLLLERGKNATENDGKQQFWDDAENKYRRALSIDSENLNVFFNLACLYGLRQNIGRCLEWLEKWFAADSTPAIEKLEKIENESDFDPVRDTPEFQAFLEQHREKPSSGEE